MGGEIVTVAAFAALLLYGLMLFATADGRIGRFAALLISASSGTWLVLVVMGPLRTGLASWSPVAVMLLAIGMEGRAVSYPERSVDRQSREAREPKNTPELDSNPTIADGRETRGS
jgi:hypothetical protein